LVRHRQNVLDDTAVKPLFVIGKLLAATVFEFHYTPGLLLKVSCWFKGDIPV